MDPQVIGREFDYWSPILGCDATRYSIPDANGREYYAILRRDDERAYARLRRQAEAAILQAIEMGLQPGEVKWR